MTPERLLAVVLTLAVVLATLRLAWSIRRTPPAQRPRPWRTLAVLALQPLVAVLLYATLLPPWSASASDTLTVLTAGSGAQEEWTGPVVALPEAGGVAALTSRAPDLATALRRHPDIARVHVVGHGLTPRDRGSADGLALSFTPAPLPPGVIELVSPGAAMAGGHVVVRGRVSGVEDATVALHDPAGRQVSSMRADDDGGFVLDATTRGPGEAVFELVVMAAGAVVERVDVPVQVEAAPPLRVLLLAGAPNPDVRALRRWGEDAGMALRWRIALGAGAQVGDGGRLDRATLDALDLLVLDARTWSGLGTAQRQTLDAALRDGLGVLLHLTGTPPAALRAQLRARGFDPAPGPSRAWQPAGASDDGAQLLARLGPGSEDAPFDTALAGEAPPTLAYRPLKGGAGFTGSVAPTDMGRWQAVGRGRLGVVTLADSYRLALVGRADLHAQLWGGWAATLARARLDAPGRIDGSMRVGTRATLCGLAGDADILAPDGAAVVPLPDPAADGCAAFWPRVPGWHRLRQGDHIRAFHVAAVDAAPGLHAAQLQAATAALVRDAGEAGAPAVVRRRGASWPWCLGLLVALAALWSLERGRWGLPRRPDDGEAGRIRAPG